MASHLNSGILLVFMCSLFAVGTSLHCVRLYVRHGTVSCSKAQMVPGTTCRITCTAGYSPLGSPERMCQPNGYWTPNKPTICRPRPCAPLKVEHGNVVYSHKDLEVDTTATVTCNQGFALNGDAKVECQPDSTWSGTPTCGPPTGTIRLVGPSPMVGRVEVYYHGKWGTVCDDLFNSNSAKVVCGILGFSRDGAVAKQRYGGGSGTIWMDNVVCKGTESSLDKCSHNPIGNHNCGHHEDVGVTCSTPTGHVRLVGPSPNTGRVEVYYNGKWGTVCDDRFTANAAKVVCGMLGYPRDGAVAKTYGGGSGTIWLDNVVCQGTEASLDKCTHNPIGNHNCGHHEDVGVTCRADKPRPTTPSEKLGNMMGKVRVVGPSGLYGRVEVQYKGKWGTVCDDNFDANSATVVCGMLGFSRKGAKAIPRYGGGSGGIVLDDLRCKGTEARIDQCTYSPIGQQDCEHSEDVGVSCKKVPVVRLVGGTPTSGRLEVFHGGKWGTVCDDHFNDVDARVVCRMLELNEANAKSKHRFGGGSGTIWLDDVQCKGTEDEIMDCPKRAWGQHNCGHHEDVGVSCT